MLIPEEFVKMMQVELADLAPFRPCAFLDKRNNDIYVIIRDCSILERQVLPWLTFLFDNYTWEHVGFILHSASSYGEERNLSKMFDRHQRILSSNYDIALIEQARKLAWENNLTEVEVGE